MFKIKQIPEDFVVKENMCFKPEKGDYAYFLLTKKNWSTIKAIEKIAKVMNISKKRFSYSGLKDKNAVTTQYISCFGLKKAKKFKIKDIKLKHIGFKNKPLSIGSHSSNSFKIVVRNLKHSLAPLKFICNYYDDQRFGGVRPINHLIGREVLRENYRKAIKLYLAAQCKEESCNHQKLRKEISRKWGSFDIAVPGYMENEIKVLRFLRENPKDFSGAFEKLPERLKLLFVNAFQAYIFNKTLNDYITKNCQDYFSISCAIGKLRCTDINIKIKIPLPGYDFSPSSEVDEIAARHLKSERIKCSMFGKIKTSFRYGCFGISKLKISQLANDDLNKGRLKQIVQFTAPKGSFATIVIKSLFSKSLALQLKQKDIEKKLTELPLLNRNNANSVISQAERTTLQKAGLFCQSQDHVFQRIYQTPFFPCQSI